jgi:hypothetical protein
MDTLDLSVKKKKINVWKYYTENALSKMNNEFKVSIC